MKYTLTINQKQALELGMKNINQVIILGLIADAHSWAEPEIINDVVYFWTARQKIAHEIPILNLKPDSVYRHLKSLSDLKLIDYVKVGKKDCVKLTKLGKSYYVGNKSENDNNSEMNPTKLGNESENNSEMNPTYKNTNSIRVTSNKRIKGETPRKTSIASDIEEKLSTYSNININSFYEWIETKNFKSIAPVTKVLNFLSNYDMQTQQQIVDASIMNGWKGLFEPKMNSNNTKSFKQQDAQRKNDVVDIYQKNNFNLRDHLAKKEDDTKRLTDD